MRKSRRPQHGDLIVEHINGEKYLGMVVDINLGKWGHQENVFILWANEEPRNYNKKYGYSGMNIHNQYDRYDIIREGKKV